MAHAAPSHAESGRDGDACFGPYGRDEPFSAAEPVAHATEGWSRPASGPGWRRAWGAFDGAGLVAAATLRAGGLPAELHRATLGMSVRRSHRQRGLGRRMREDVVAWCRREPSITWLDLGVLDGNRPARSFLDGAGFETVGRVPDRRRLDGRPLGTTLMTLHVATPHGGGHDGDALSDG